MANAIPSDSLRVIICRLITDARVTQGVGDAGNACAAAASNPLSRVTIGRQLPVWKSNGAPYQDALDLIERAIVPAVQS
jgi:hypothetical protein